MFGISAIDSYEFSAPMFWKKASKAPVIKLVLPSHRFIQQESDLRVSLSFLEGLVSMNLKNLGKI